ncbi:MAG: hypothetical protein ACYTE6_00890 [Planctomycetota bacterium]
MNRIHGALVAIAVMLAAVMSGCSGDTGTGESEASGALTASRGEHDREGYGEHDRGGGEHGGESGEESDTELALDERYDAVRNGVRLILAYSADSNSFMGTVENTTDRTLRRVRVEVHLSNGIELGPTTPVDLGPGARRAVGLAATDEAFDGWTAHPEVGSGEHGHGEGRGEHD